MVNSPPTHCPYCGTELTAVDPPTIQHCSSCDDYVYYNPTPGGSVAVVDGNGDALLLVEDFRYDDEWKLPSGRVECGESPTEGVIRELEEETGLTVDADDLHYSHDAAGQPVDDMYMTNFTFSVVRSKTSGTLEAGDDATDARFWSAEEFATANASFTDVHVDRFETDSFEWLLETVRDPLDAE